MRAEILPSQCTNCSQCKCRALERNHVTRKSRALQTWPEISVDQALYGNGVNNGHRHYHMTNQEKVGLITVWTQQICYGQNHSIPCRAQKESNVVSSEEIQHPLLCCVTVCTFYWMAQKIRMRNKIRMKQKQEKRHSGKGAIGSLADLVTVKTRVII